MKKEEKLVNKFKCLLRRIGMPRWLHHFGPKKYTLIQHLVALILKEEFKCGYRRISKALRQLGIKCPTYNALWYSRNRIPLAVWERIFNATRPQKCYIVALDGTGMSRILPSPYYYKRIDKPYPVEIPLKLSLAVDTRTKKIVALRLRATRAHDIKDAKYLIKRLPTTEWIVADKAYDANWLHEYCNQRSIKCCIPVRERGTPRFKKHNLRRKNMKNLHHKRYGRREIIEATFKSTKTKFGPAINSILISAQRAEMYCRAIAHNLICIIQDFLNGALPKLLFYFV